MKNLFFLISMSLLFLVSSCNKNKEINHNDVLGEWNITAIETSSSEYFSVDTIQFETVYSGKGSNINGKAIFTDSDFYLIGTADIESIYTDPYETETSVEVDVDLSGEIASYQLQNSKLILSYDDEDIIYTISDWNSKLLLLETSQTIENTNSDGVYSKFTNSALLRLER